MFDLMCATELIPAQRRKALRLYNLLCKLSITLQQHFNPIYLTNEVYMTFSNNILFAQTSTSALGFYDWFTLLAYFGVLLGVAWWVVRQKTGTSQDYFLAGKKAGWIVIGASLFASNIGSEHLVGLAGTGASDGMAMAHYELHAWCLLVLGWVMVPFYERSCVYTMPEFLERRYSASSRWFLSIISLIAYVMTKISVTLFAGGIVFKALFPIDIMPGVSNFWVGAIGMVLITGLYTILGGLRAVLYTELMQTVVLLIGAASVLFVGLYQVCGWEKLKETVQGKDYIVAFIVEDVKDTSGGDILVKRPKLIGEKRKTISSTELTTEDLINANLIERLDGQVYAELLNSIGSNERSISDVAPEDKRVKSDHFNLWKPNSDPVFPWFGLLFGAPIVGLWYWCTDQYIVQRTLAAKNQREARRGTIFGAYLKMTPVFLFIVPGMIAYALAVQGKIGAEVLFEPNQAFPILVREVLPVGLKGLVVGALLAALMSSLASVFNSCSTLFTMDIYTKIQPKASETQLVWVGRVATAAMVILGLVWIPVISYMPGTLYGYLQSVQSYVAPPIFAVFFLGVFVRRTNAYGCMSGLVVGFVLGMMRLGLEIANGFSPFESGTFLCWFATTSYTFVCIYLTVICALVIIGVSILTPKPREEQLVGLTYATVTAEQIKTTRDSWNWLDVILTVGLLVIIVTIYTYFTG
jgi:SSS family solute:Na+ symporter